MTERQAMIGYGLDPVELGWLVYDTICQFAHMIASEQVES
jgi:uncharacterized membrane protein